MENNFFNKEHEYIDQRFEEIEMQASHVEDRSFDGCTFYKVNFSGTTFIRCRFLDCTFEQSELSNVNLLSSQLKNVKFKECKLVGINWTATTALMHTTWQNSILNYGNFSGLDLRKSILQNCVSREADYAETNLSESNLTGTDFTSSRFANTNLTKADLRQAKNYSIRPDSNKIKKAKFSLPEAMLLLYGLDIELEE